jgi:hypothetical protein
VQGDPKRPWLSKEGVLVAILAVVVAAALVILILILTAGEEASRTMSLSSSADGGTVTVSPVHPGRRTERLLAGAAFAPTLATDRGGRRDGGGAKGGDRPDAEYPAGSTGSSGSATSPAPEPETPAGGSDGSGTSVTVGEVEVTVKDGPSVTVTVGETEIEVDPGGVLP